MVAFLHTSPNLHLIAEAAKNADLDAALRPIMSANGIQHGDVAGIYFAEHVSFWPHASVSERNRLLCEWLWTEFQMRADDAKPSPDEFHIVPDHSEPRQSVYYVMRRGQVAKTCYSQTEAEIYISDETGQDFETDNN